MKHLREFELKDQYLNRPGHRKNQDEWGELCFVPRTGKEPEMLLKPGSIWKTGFSKLGKW